MGNPITHNREVAKNNMITSIRKVSENGDIRGINRGKLRWQNQKFFSKSYNSEHQIYENIEKIE